LKNKVSIKFQKLMRSEIKIGYNEIKKKFYKEEKK